MIPAKRNLDSPEPSPSPRKRDSGVCVSPISSPTSSTPKLAPRSKSLYKTGPAFINGPQSVALCSSNGTPATIRLHARLDRGFEEESGNWICYRRNYMSLCAAFDIVEHSIVPMTPVYPSGPVYIASGPHENAACLYFVLRVEAKVCSTNAVATLMQHTAKRDPGSQTSPSDIILFPGKLPPHEFIRDSANVRCPKKLESIFNKCNLTVLEQRNLSKNQGLFLETYPDANEEAIAKVARFERLQFQFIHRSRREGCKYSLQVSLLAMISHNGIHDLIEITSCETPEIIVRGRSPASYTELGPSKKSCETKAKEPKESRHSGYVSPEPQPEVTAALDHYYGLDLDAQVSEFDVTDNLEGDVHGYDGFKFEASSPSLALGGPPPRFSLPDLSQSLSASDSDFTSDEESTQVAQLINLPPPPKLSNGRPVEVKTEPDELEEFTPQLTFDSAGFALEAGSEPSFEI